MLFSLYETEKTEFNTTVTVLVGSPYFERSSFFIVTALKYKSLLWLKTRKPKQAAHSRISNCLSYFPCCLLF